MKVTGNIQKWGAAALGIASLLLLVNLVQQLRHGRTEGTNAGARTRPASPAKALPGAKVAAAKPKVPDELSRYDPIVKLDVLKETERRPLAELDRDPFLFAGEPAPVAHGKVAGKTAPTPPPPPPPPPPVTLTVMGYSEGKGGADEAMVSDENQQVLLVHAGDSVGTRYKIVKIAPTAVTVEDSATHQTVDLPVPQ
jgi:hypothetical protein